MIFNKYGRQVELISFCGKHIPNGLSIPYSLCKARMIFMPDTEHQATRTRYVFIENLHDQAGRMEIGFEFNQLLLRVNVELLKGDKLRYAIADASY